MKSTTVQSDPITHDLEFERLTLEALSRAHHISILNLPDEFDDFADVLELIDLDRDCL